MASRIAPFDSQQLEAACRVLADTANGLSGTQIGRLLQEINVPDPSSDMTKWKRLFNALAGMQNKHQAGNHLIQFINLAMNPVSYARDPGAFAWRRDELNVVLAFSGFYVRDDGKVAHSAKATTLDAARARAGRLKAALESRAVHPEVLTYCRAELMDDNYFHAVFEATKGVAERIRILSGLTGDGSELVTQAFMGQQPLLVLGPLTSESEKSEQRGFANLLIGLFGAVRNPLAHAPKTNWPMSEQDALDILTLVSLIQRKLDSVRKNNL
ncbi:TIGR02391 family protein [Pseudomonas aeruginosa]|uniref:TIGR02391 family protein n=1 Tax=Pseudomonas aeruginosa TaxID=287 RepID=UPI00071B7967|nr:TIGR02391 family protein [Pseudomonas aeruginosa]KSI13996.1 TIGR02391 family protein [Pseudomonas aeruginosa]MBH3725067.1 TIGR02391 family protein [Pseudomonas aeruginosa]MBH3776564.1 TIGR02391 family protein [Pseudomonas aeruginosa]MCF3988011.1 TIGR02391 family protein [Pseudomonas aeruginosa]MCF3999768.1 TIGR02391 family protein [Pseudomonas aeruginosa]